jgi:hypothetical protein
VLLSLIFYYRSSFYIHIIYFTITVHSTDSSLKMKYIIFASIFSSAAFAAPLAQQGQTNTNAGIPQAGAGTTGAQTGAGQVPQQGVQQGVQQGATQGQIPGQNVPAGSTGAVNSPQQGAGIANGQTPTTGDLATAVANWMADTSMVSNFLNTGASIQNNVAFKQAATVAFNAEVDELNHKAIIDRATASDPNVIAANSTLATGGAFQDVVDKLQIMSVQGRAAVSNIDLINQNRCTNGMSWLLSQQHNLSNAFPVLPNIDAYMASTGQPGAAVRPTVCDNTGVIGGVQSQGPTQPGGTPGTPQAAFDAANALAAGTGNGLVNGGAGGTLLLST